ncbi:aminopeptidase-like protein [Thermochaetoides thermophila DSM 1495]|uniref:Aminopeptidase-like protein n=1 Tax=Chaetomium thermophilum (strain DSM 1495 / CBS 144.50 / IMI 039719) TaxID=759272 RepID=G0SG74_CHATD|nr:aminopeptidase-like protein [Thermochaetoides thermophila DSM 1495]5JM6_A Chain A, Aminopeptidase-like protein [Thermochaetoides thermophila]5JM6_B Chain B, Aminopeptidase-like protein [Thermochaetoides thermophila]5JM6_C Chain C, Aminopeptidase-like protein [Thermochaetoides thermophila]5JM6_D Chain D, Aminopeptidase-like protein [Thermochaetoides thermophila]5JM6_E Chain E, Aminopeptidase-like protein [Thermochaetoides thermophila]5JM6_F Chain F, Aminopeptidase-like protein [Thermochaeto
MTRLTPDVLRMRSSQLSLRSLAMEQPQQRTAAPPTIDEAPTVPLEAKDLRPEHFTQPYLDFMTHNPTVFHVVDYCKQKLLKAGYVELPARDSWTGKLVPGGKYFTTRNGSSIIAFTVGQAYKPGNGIAMIAGHIDALTARLKPTSVKPTKEGYVQLGVAQYAGALNETWWDRDLSVGGRVIVKDPKTGKTTVKLVKVDWPVARIPTLAPHFGIGMTGHGNRETEMVPVIGIDNSDLLGEKAESEKPVGKPGSFASTQPPKLVKLILSQLGLSDPDSILNWELELFDAQPATVGGLDKEFIFAGRIDDKLCSWAAFMALLHAKRAPTDGVIKLVALFDDEEIGSLLRQGARGNFLPITIERILESFCSSNSVPFGPGILGQTYARSFLVSSDVTHAAHPNFTQTNLPGHSPRLNVGVALCVDASAHMTTDSVSMAILDRIAELSGCVNQRHMIRNDSRSGGTVGPMLSAAMGVKAADVGIPQLSMHSIRAMTGSLDPGLGVKFYKGFLDFWEEVDLEWSH